MACTWTGLITVELFTGEVIETCPELPGGWMVAVAVPFAPVLSDAVMVQVPVVLGAVNIPELVMDPQLVVQVTARPPLSVAVNCWVVPSVTVAVEGLTVIVFVVAVVTVMFTAVEEKTVPVLASAACTTIRCEPAAMATDTSKVLVLFCTALEAPSRNSFIYLAVPL